MFIGPVFTREVTIAPRREWTYIFRSVYVGLLLLLIVTARLVISGTQLITDPGDFARFGHLKLTKRLMLYSKFRNPIQNRVLAKPIGYRKEAESRGGPSLNPQP